MSPAGRFPLRCLAISLAVAAISVPAMAQAAPPPNTTTWTLIGPTRTFIPAPSRFFTPEASGRIRSIAVDRSGTVYIGAADGGVWKLVGSSWVSLTDFQPSLATGAIAIDPSNSNTIYVATGESPGSTSSYYGRGILKTTDAGSTWTNIIGPFLNDIDNAPNGALGRHSGGAHIGALAVSPTNSNVLLAGVEMRSSSCDVTDSGIYRSSDSGLTWSPVQLGNVGTSVLFDPTNGNVAYAALGSLCGIVGSGIYKSEDAGQTWIRLTGTPPNVLPVSNIGQIRLAISKSNPQILYAGISNSADLPHLLGLYKTMDGGMNWTMLSGAPDYCAYHCEDTNELAVHPTNPDIVLVGGSDHPVYRTLDGGLHWGEISGVGDDILHLDVRALAFSPDGSTAYVGTDGGIASSNTYTTLGRWTFMNGNLAITQIYPGFDVDSTGRVFLGTQDNGFQIFSGSLLWNYVGYNTEGSHILYDPIANAAYLGGVTMAWNPFFHLWDFLITSSGISISERGAGLLVPFAINRSNPAIQFTGRSRVYQTIDRQGFWTPISAPLAGTFGFLTALAVADHNPDIVCAGTSDGHVWCTANASAGASASWTDFSAGLPNRYVTQIAINHFKEYIIAVSFSGFSGIAGDTTGHVFLSTTGGAGWTDISGNLPNAPVNDVVIDNADIDQLYAATDVGVFRTLDRGTIWAPVANGLPHSAVTGLFLQQSSRTLYAGTMGRSMWRLSVPDVTTAPGPTIALDPWVMRFSVHFGGPNTSTRILRIINAGSPLFGSTTLNWTATASTAFGGPWLATSPITGIDTAATNVSVDVTGLPLGLYNGIVRVSDPASTNTPQDLTVLLAVTDSPPSASAGAAISTDATTPAGAAVTLNGLGSTDPDNDPLTYGWTGPFGKATGPTPTVQIPIGTYTVTLTVADPAGLTSKATVKVTVLSPSQMTSALIAVVGNLGFQQAVDLLNSALTKIQGGDTVAACNKLRAFENQVQAQSGKQLSAVRAKQLVTSANHIVGALGCQ